MSTKERGRSSYLDLLITTLMEHEKNLDRLVERLEKIYKDLSTVYETADSETKKRTAGKKKGKAVTSDSDTLIYMKIKIDRELDEITKIIESLKE